MRKTRGTCARKSGRYIPLSSSWQYSLQELVRARMDGNKGKEEGPPTTEAKEDKAPDERSAAEEDDLTYSDEFVDIGPSGITIKWYQYFYISILFF